MRPREQRETGQFDMLRARLDQIINLDHELVRLGREPLQQHAEIRRIYSQAAGLTHCLMDGDEGRFRSALVDYLSVIYLGRANTATLEKLTGTTLSALDETYKGFLQVRDADLNDLLPPEHRQRLVLAHTAITNRGLEKLADSTALEWLGLDERDFL